MEELRIKNIRPPINRDPEKDLEWFCETFGILSERDRNKTAFRIFKIFVEKSKKGEKVTINELKDITKLSRTTIVHHLKYLEESGIVVEKKRDYELRRECLHKIVEEVEKDMLRFFDEVKEMAREIDEGFGIKFRNK
ncbi:MAG: helix-turn-helix domain-containing protein [Candidatus Aenigmatarchaeota archaeon]